MVLRAEGDGGLHSSAASPGFARSVNTGAEGRNTSRRKSRNASTPSSAPAPVRRRAKAGRVNEARISRSIMTEPLSMGVVVFPTTTRLFGFRLEKEGSFDDHGLTGLEALGNLDAVTKAVGRAPLRAARSSLSRGREGRSSLRRRCRAAAGTVTTSSGRTHGSQRCRSFWPEDTSRIATFVRTGIRRDMGSTWRPINPTLPGYV